MIPFLAVIKKYKILLLVILAILINAGALYTMYLSREKTRLTQDYKSTTTSVVATKKGDQTVYTKPVETVTMSEFKDMFQQEFQHLKKDLDLKAIQSVTNVNTVTKKDITTTARDTTIHSQTIKTPSRPSQDTILKGKTWSYNDKSIDIKVLEIDSIRKASWKHTLDLLLVKSKQPRVGIKKLFIWNPRPLIINAIPSDTNTIITNLRERVIK